MIYEQKLNQDHSDLLFESEPHPGCMWGILHILNFHQWHTVKKMLTYRRHSGGRHAEGTKDMRTEMDVPDSGEAQELMHSVVDEFLSEERMSEMSPTQKKSGKARMKKLIAEAMSKHNVHKSRLLRIDSIHHIGPSHQDLPDEVRIDGESPTVDLNQDDASTPSSSTWNSVQTNLPFHKHCEVCRSISTFKSLGPNQLDELKRLLTENHMDKAEEPSLKQKALSDMELHRDVALYQTKEFLEALEIFSVKKELFLKILEDPDYALAHHFQGLWASNAKRGLTRSGTFPLANSTEEKIMKRIKLKNKQKEKEQRGKLGTDNQPLTSTNECSEDNYVKTIPLVADNNADSVDQGSTIVGETDANVDSSPGSSHELKKRGHRFKDIKQKIKHAIKESRKEAHRVSMDAILHKIPYGRRFSKNTKKEMTKQWKESAMDIDSKDSSKSSYECSSPAFTPGKGGLHRMRRTASLSESLDRYAQLFESSFNREAKQHLTDRLKLTNEDGGPPVGHAPKVLGRILSLPDLECYRSLQCEVTPVVLYSGKPTGILVKTRDNESLTYNEQNSLGKPISKEDCIQLDACSESRNQENLVEVDESRPFKRDPMELALDSNGGGIAEVGESGKSEELDTTMGECNSISQYEPGTGLANNISSKLAQPSPVSVFDFSLQEGVASSPAKFFIPEGHELKTRCIKFDEPESSCNGQDQSGLGSPSVAGRTTVLENLRIQSKNFDSDYLQVQVDGKDQDNFNYVKDVLTLSGFTGNKYLENWHSPDQPLDPSLFEEMECLSPYKAYCAEGETSISYYDHQLLFDTINEVLLEIYQRSFTYWPWPLSCNTSGRPIPFEHHVLEEVWTSISWYLSSQPEEDPSLDYVVARDLSKVDGWMNLQVDSECVGLELEELILNDLLEEVIYS
ncbi:Protein of unknown function DUF3741 [Macleaya cordata]|uniref:DUF4378 domain-containing protein n=1 Tax=Macleaya cordata TaxID=56857 RepID=A0A200Q644_MACCD|nr:Protein of unknown function DUF3741 [Macleaya cordata]